MKTKTLSVNLPEKIYLTDVLLYLLLFVAIFTSSRWYSMPHLAVGEIFRFDTISIGGAGNVYFLFAVVFFLLTFLILFGPRSKRIKLGKTNFLKSTFWLYFIPVNILVYLTIHLENIPLAGMGVGPIAKFFGYLAFTAAIWSCQVVVPFTESWYCMSSWSPMEP